MTQFGPHANYILLSMRDSLGRSSDKTQRSMNATVNINNIFWLQINIRHTQHTTKRTDRITTRDVHVSNEQYRHLQSIEGQAVRRNW